MTSPDDTALPVFCPFCGQFNNRHQATHAAAIPRDGDVGICWSCRKVSVFDGGTVRRPTAEEQAQIDAHEGVRLAQAVAQESRTPDEAREFIRGILDGDPP